MKNKKIKIAYFLTTFIFLFTYIGGLLGNIKSYAYDATYVALVSTTKPSSGSFKSSTKSSTKIQRPYLWLPTQSTCSSAQA